MGNSRGIRPLYIEKWGRLLRYSYVASIYWRPYCATILHTPPHGCSLSLSLSVSLSVCLIFFVEFAFCTHFHPHTMNLAFDQIHASSTFQRSSSQPAIPLSPLVPPEPLASENGPYRFPESPAKLVLPLSGHNVHQTIQLGQNGQKFQGYENGQEFQNENGQKFQSFENGQIFQGSQILQESQVPQALRDGHSVPRSVNMLTQFDSKAALNMPYSEKINYWLENIPWLQVEPNMWVLDCYPGVCSSVGSSEIGSTRDHEDKVEYQSWQVTKLVTGNYLREIEDTESRLFDYDSEY